MSEMREEFESALLLAGWSRNALLLRNQPGHPKDGQYRNTQVQAAWWGWQASAAVNRSPENP